MVSVDAVTELMRDVVNRAYNARKNSKGATPLPIASIASIVSEDARGQIIAIETNILQAEPRSTNMYLFMVEEAQLDIPLVEGWGAILAADFTRAIEMGFWGDWAAEIIASYYNEGKNGTYLPPMSVDEVENHALVVCCRNKLVIPNGRQQAQLIRDELQTTMVKGSYPDIGRYFSSYRELERLPLLAGALESLLPLRVILADEIFEQYKSLKTAAEIDLELDRQKEEVGSLTEIDRVERVNALREHYIDLLAEQTLIQGRFINQATTLLLSIY